MPSATLQSLTISAKPYLLITSRELTAASKLVLCPLLPSADWSCTQSLTVSFPPLQNSQPFNHIVQIKTKSLVRASTANKETADLYSCDWTLETLQLECQFLTVSESDKLLGSIGRDSFMKYFAEERLVIAVALDRSTSVLTVESLLWSQSISLSEPIPENERIFDTHASSAALVIYFGVDGEITRSLIIDLTTFKVIVSTQLFVFPLSVLYAQLGEETLDLKYRSKTILRIPADQLFSHQKIPLRATNEQTTLIWSIEVIKADPLTTFGFSKDFSLPNMEFAYGSYHQWPIDSAKAFFGNNLKVAIEVEEDLKRTVHHVVYKSSPMNVYFVDSDKLGPIYHIWLGDGFAFAQSRHEGKKQLLYFSCLQREVTDIGCELKKQIQLTETTKNIAKVQSPLPNLKLVLVNNACSGQAGVVLLLDTDTLIWSTLMLGGSTKILDMDYLFVRVNSHWRLRVLLVDGTHVTAHKLDLYDEERYEGELFRVTDEAINPTAIRASQKLCDPVSACKVRVVSTVASPDSGYRLKINELRLVSSSPFLLRVYPASSLFYSKSIPAACFYREHSLLFGLDPFSNKPFIKVIRDDGVNIVDIAALGIKDLFSVECGNDSPLMAVRRPDGEVFVLDKRYTLDNRRLLHSSFQASAETNVESFFHSSRAYHVLVAPSKRNYRLSLADGHQIFSDIYANTDEDIVSPSSLTRLARYNLTLTGLTGTQSKASGTLKIFPQSRQISMKAVAHSKKPLSKGVHDLEGMLRIVGAVFTSSLQGASKYNLNLTRRVEVVQHYFSEAVDQGIYEGVAIGADLVTAAWRFVQGRAIVELFKSHLLEQRYELLLPARATVGTVDLNNTYFLFGFTDPYSAESKLGIMELEKRDGSKGTEGLLLPEAATKIWYIKSCLSHQIVITRHLHSSSVFSITNKRLSLVGHYPGLNRLDAVCVKESIHLMGFAQGATSIKTIELSLGPGYALLKTGEVALFEGFGLENIRCAAGELMRPVCAVNTYSLYLAVVSVDLEQPALSTYNYHEKYLLYDIFDINISGQFVFGFANTTRPGLKAHGIFVWRQGSEFSSRPIYHQVELQTDLDEDVDSSFILPFDVAPLGRDAYLASAKLILANPLSWYRIGPFSLEVNDERASLAGLRLWLYGNQTNYLPLTALFEAKATEPQQYQLTAGQWVMMIGGGLLALAALMLLARALCRRSSDPPLENTVDYTDSLTLDESLVDHEEPQKASTL